MALISRFLDSQMPEFNLAIFLLFNLAIFLLFLIFSSFMGLMGPKVGQKLKKDLNFANV